MAEFQLKQNWNMQYILKREKLVLMFIIQKGINLSKQL